MKRRDRIGKKRTQTQIFKEETPIESGDEKHRNNFYFKYYKQLMIIPFALLIISLVLIGIRLAETGDFINKGITLKGGMSITIVDGALDAKNIEKQLNQEFPKNEINIRTLESTGTKAGIIIESDLLPENTKETENFVNRIKQITNAKDEVITIEAIGSSLGDAFFRQTMVAMIIAFVFMAIVVFLHFKTFVPSMAVVLAAFSNIAITIAVVNLMGMKVGTAGIAALLMLIGYSVDTDILLSTRVLKSTHGTVYERITSGIMTGFIMNATTLAAVLVAMFVAESDVLKEIVTIVLIGLFADMLNTWIQNAGILRWYFERKEKQKKAENNE
jgi:preprotein translocase subunit SecF